MAWKKQPTFVKLGPGVPSTCPSAAPWQEGPQRTSLPPEPLLGLFFPLSAQRPWASFLLVSLHTWGLHRDGTWLSRLLTAVGPPGPCPAHSGCSLWTQRGREGECEPCLGSAASLTLPALGASSASLNREALASSACTGPVSAGRIYLRHARAVPQAHPLYVCRPRCPARGRRSVWMEPVQSP